MEEEKLSSQLEEITEEDENKCYQDLFEHAMHLLNDHQKPVELVAGTMMAIAHRLYKTHLDEDEYKQLMETIMTHPNVEPYEVKKVRIN